MLFASLPEKKDILLDTAAHDCVSKDEEKQPSQIAMQETPRQRISAAVVWKTLTNIQKWPHFLTTACVFATWSPLTTYIPSTVMSLGIFKVKSNALVTVGNFITLPVILFFCLAER